MADVLNDGDVLYGTPVLTISGTDYITTAFDYNETVAVTIVRRNQIAVPTGRVYIKENPEGTATLQLLTSATPIPAQFAEFSTTIRGVSVDFTILTVGLPRGNEIETVVNITFAKLIN